VAQVIVSPRAKQDVDEAISRLNLPIEMLLLYSYDEDSDQVFIVSMHDARSAASPRSSG